MGGCEAPPTSECTNQVAVWDGPQLTEAAPVEPSLASTSHKLV